MERIVIKLSREVKRHFHRTIKKIKDAGLWISPTDLDTGVTDSCYVKHYLAGAMDARTRRVIRVEGDRKRSALFIELLIKLNRLYAEAKVIHIILDNYVIHTSKITQKAVEKFNGKIVLHFLRPYFPDDNKIERCLWRDACQRDP